MKEKERARKRKRFIGKRARWKRACSCRSFFCLFVTSIFLRCFFFWFIRRGGTKKEAGRRRRRTGTHSAGSLPSSKVVRSLRGKKEVRKARKMPEGKESAAVNCFSKYRYRNLLLSLDKNQVPAGQRGKGDFALYGRGDCLAKFIEKKSEFGKKVEKKREKRR